MIRGLATIGSPGRRQLSSRRERGFTIIELMTVMIVVAVLLAVAVPSYSVLVLRTKLKSYANEAVASVYLARSEAIKRNGLMRLCISTDGETCEGSGDWDRGWIVMDPNETVIRRQQSLAGGIVMFEQSSIHTITFQPSGVASTSATMTVCQETPASPVVEEREIRVLATGRPRISTTNSGCSP